MKTDILTDRDGVKYLTFWCPGCEQIHGPVVARPDPRRPFWEWDGSRDRPTLSPSILVRSSKPLTDEEVQRVLGGEHIEPVPTVCHSFLRQGRLEFLGDCTHALAGQTVDLPEIPE